MELSGSVGESPAKRATDGLSRVELHYDRDSKERKIDDFSRLLTSFASTSLFQASMEIRAQLMVHIHDCIGP